MKQARGRYDVIVVGAGPAGSTAAKQLAQAGLRVLLAEQRQAVGTYVQCAEFVPRLISRCAGLRDVDVAQPVQGIKTFINGELASQLRAPGYVLHRKVWDEYQAAAAAAAGADVVTGVRAVSVSRSKVTLFNGSGYGEATAKFILGCDGPRSVVSKALGNELQEVCVALQYELSLVKPLNFAEIHFDPAYYGGYAWVFPKGNTANIGVAIHASQRKRLKQSLADFCRQLIALQVVQDRTAPVTTGGVIPAGGLAPYVANDSMLVAGDAAGCTHPITGAGIMNAVVSGRLAAMAVIRQMNSGGQESLAVSYPRALQAEFGRQFTIARSRLINRNQGWTEDKQGFGVLIRRNWIGFREYYAQS